MSPPPISNRTTEKTLTSSLIQTNTQKGWGKILADLKPLTEMYKSTECKQKCIQSIKNK